ncbi:MAG: DUF255 domain-containing protein [Thiohalophilus sp.]|jgi:hypothetical protein
MRHFIKGLGCTWLLLAASTASALELKNQLAGHGSAYLAMHGQDPVHWQQWNADTVELARKQNKLLYVSSGYFSCHWCHVMQRESYQDNRIAELLNSHFIPVKVDRELNPALDDRLIDFVERTQGYSGWPLNVFITPEGYPLVGMVYQPRDDFQRILERIHQEWQSKAGQLAELARTTTQEINSRDRVENRLQAGELRNRLVTASLQQADELQGGFGDQNKFPSVPQLDALLTIYQESRNKELGEFLRLTLDMMAERGLYDHLAGGFFRYVVDPAWQVPHFEKMLYDNALLASLYLRAGVVFDKPGYRQVGLETLSFMQRDFQLDNGGLLASFSAIDDQNVEGGYYLWREDEVKNLLSDTEFQIATRVWGISGPPELEHGHHLQQVIDVATVAKTLGLSEARASKSLASAQQKLLDKRQQRILPEDQKQIAAWNGLALTAFVAGSQQDSGLQRSTTRLRDFILQELWDDKSGTLKRASGSGMQLGQVGLEDYAYVAQGLLDYADYAEDAVALKAAGELIHQAWQRFYSPAGWQLQEQPLLKYSSRQAVLADGPMPSPSAVLIAATNRWLGQFQEGSLKGQIVSALEQHSAALHETPFWFASHIMQLDQAGLSGDIQGGRIYGRLIHNLELELVEGMGRQQEFPQTDIKQTALHVN